MADHKISEYPAVSDLDDADELVLARSGATKKISGADLRADIGGSSAPPNNVAIVGLSNGGTLNAGNAWGWSPLVADMEISHQSGTDLSVGDDGGGYAQLISAAGGWFQIGCYFGVPDGVTLDPGATNIRSFTLAASIGAFPTLYFRSFGIDLSLPVDDSSGGGVPALTVASVPGYVAPGGSPLRSIIFSLVGASGADEVTGTLNGFSDFAVWQIPALT